MSEAVLRFTGRNPVELAWTFGAVAVGVGVIAGAQLADRSVATGVLVGAGAFVFMSLLGGLVYVSWRSQVRGNLVEIDGWTVSGMNVTYRAGGRVFRFDARDVVEVERIVFDDDTPSRGWHLRVSYRTPGGELAQAFVPTGVVGRRTEARRAVLELIARVGPQASQPRLVFDPPVPERAATEQSPTAGESGAAAQDP
jgi:hypothetical protein